MFNPRQFREINDVAQKVDGWLSPHEGFFLFQTVLNLSKEAVVVEIGSWKGKSTLYLARAAKLSGIAKIVAIDPHKGERTGGKVIETPTFPQFAKNLKSANLLSYVRPIIKTSEQAAKSWGQKKIDFLFIDGLHDVENTSRDFRLWAPKVKNGGIIALHDAFCGHEGPEQVTEEILLRDGRYSGVAVVGSIVFAKKQTVNTSSEQLNRIRHQLLIPLAIQLNKTNFPFKFIIIHRIIKFLLMNQLTISATKLQI